MNKDTINNLIQVRKAVGYLGEKKEWWKSSFFESSSRDFLKYIFPKTNKGQSYFSTFPIRNKIDEVVGANYYHLFRLPSNFEEAIEKSFIPSDFQDIENESNAFNILEKIANDLSINQNSGPKNIGSIDHLNNETIQVFAAEYLSAFKNDYRAYPYLN